MLDPNSFDARWTLLAGLPIIGWLAVSAWRRSRAVAQRIREVRVEMARHPQDPYQSLAALMAEEEAKTAESGQAKSQKNAGRR